MTSVSARIRRALLGLALGLSAVFALLALLLLYVTEDRIFVNQLQAEQEVLERLPGVEQAQWQPANRHMRILWSRASLSDLQKSVVGDRPGVYEYFAGPTAFFVLSGRLPDSREYFITYEVGELLAVRQNRPAIAATFGIGVAIVAVCAMIVALYLAKLTLRPLRTLTGKLSSDSVDDLPANFAGRFGHDEIGLLAEALERALDRVRASARREFEFNQGVSHELRSPIQVAKNASELLHIANRGADEPGVSEPLKRLDRAIAQMENVTEAFLWLAANRSVSEARSDARAETEKLVRDYRYLLNGRSVEIDVEPDGLTYRIPAPVFSVVVGNLLRNAIQHSDDGPLRCKLSAERIVVENRAAGDSGDGKTAGFGVGLEIVERICRRQGWRLTLAGSGDATVRAVVDIDSQDAFRTVGTHREGVKK